MDAKNRSLPSLEMTRASSSQGNGRSLAEGLLGTGSAIHLDTEHKQHKELPTVPFIRTGASGA